MSEEAMGKKYPNLEEEKYTVIRDTREKPHAGWTWGPSDHTIGTIIQTMETGDYTIVGYEDFVCIERKATVTEIANNLREDRFEKEMERLSKFQHKFIVCEFNMTDVAIYPEAETKMPQDVKNKVQMKGTYIIRRLTEIELKYGVHIVFAGNVTNAKWYVSSIFKRLMQGVTPYKS